MPSACVLHSIEHGRYDGIPTSLVQKATEFMSKEEMKNKPMEEAVLLFICQSQLSREQVKWIELERFNGDSNEWEELLPQIYV